jgi:hypothetical protein
MSVTSRLVFDPAEIASAADGGSNMGAYVRAGSDGDLIASQSAHSEEWLNTASKLYASDGGVLTEVTMSGDAGAIDVNVVNTFTVNDAALADTAIANGATAVSTTAIDVSTPLANRKYLYLANEGNKSLYIGAGGGTVTAANGFPLHPGMQIEMRIGASQDLEVIGETGASSEDLRYLEAS